MRAADSPRTKGGGDQWSQQLQSPLAWEPDLSGGRTSTSGDDDRLCPYNKRQVRRPVRSVVGNNHVYVETIARLAVARPPSLHALIAPEGESYGYA